MYLNELNIMKNIKSILLVFGIVALTFSSCDEGFEELNINPNISADNVAPKLIFGSVMPDYLSLITGSYNYAGQWAQQLAIKNSSIGNYQEEDNHTRGYWQDAYVRGALRNMVILLDMAEESGFDNYKAVTQIMWVHHLSHLTDMYGDVPYSDVGRGFDIDDSFNTPSYDPQEAIYEGMISYLETANELLKNNDLPSVENDMLYDGDLLGWRKFANSLRVRILMRQSNKKDVSGEVAAIFNDAGNYPVFDNINDQASFVYDIGRGYRPPHYVDPNDVTIGDTDKRPSEPLVNFLKGSSTADPRLTIFVDPTQASVDAGGALEYVGQPIGLENDTELIENRSMLSATIRNFEKFSPMTYAELLFLKTEAIAKGYVSGDAAATYTAGLEASFTYYAEALSLSDLADYIAVKDAYLADPANAYDPANFMKQIGVQRWIDGVFNGFEGYSVFRRFDFEQWNEFNPAPGQAQVPTRYWYSSKTTDRNQENAIEAINRAPLNGNNSKFSFVWWDVP